MHPHYSPASSPQQQQPQPTGSVYQPAVRGGAGHGHGVSGVTGHIRTQSNLQQLPPQMPRIQNYSNAKNNSASVSTDRSSSSSLALIAPPPLPLPLPTPSTKGATASTVNLRPNSNVNFSTTSSPTSTSTLYTCSSASSSLIAQPPPSKIFKTDHLCVNAAAYGLSAVGHPCVYCVIPVPVMVSIERANNAAVCLFILSCHT
ncbi:hypothetical protein ACLKA7_017643 [Drosophila subpalustris]